MSDTPEGFIPADQFEAEQATPIANQSSTPSDFIPEDQFESAEDYYGSTSQQIKTGVEGLASGLVSRPVAHAIETNILGVKPEDIKGRSEENPVISLGSEAVGFVAPAIFSSGMSIEARAALEAGVIGLDAAKGTSLVAKIASNATLPGLLGKAGKAAETAAGLGQASRFAKIGSSAVDQAAQMALLEAGNEADKLIINEPGTSAETAIAHIGLAAALGGVGGAFLTGAISPLWEASSAKLKPIFKALQSRYGGVEGGVANAVEATSDSLATKAGVLIPDELKGVIDAKPGFMESHSALSQSDGTMMGRGYQKRLKDFEGQVSGKILESLGKSPEEALNIAQPNKYNQGRSVGETLYKELEPEIKNISRRYEVIEEEFKGALVSMGDHAEIADNIIQMGVERGWAKATGGKPQKFADEVIQSLSKQENVNDLKLMITNLRKDNPFGTPDFHAAQDIIDILKNNQERIIGESIAKSGGTAVESAAKIADYDNLKSSYAQLMRKIKGVNEYLKVGKFSGPEAFLNTLKDFSTKRGERVIERLAGHTNANVLEVLKQFPETLSHIKNHHVEELLYNAVSKAKPGQEININNLINGIEKLSPQVKELIADQQQHGVIDAAGQILESLKEHKPDFTNAARVVLNHTKGAPSPISMVAAMMGHYGSALLSHVANIGYFEGRDAVKLGMMRFMGSTAPVDAPAFKAMVDFAHAVQKGETVLNKAAQNVFKPGVPVISGSLAADNRDAEKLDKRIDEMNRNPDKLMQASNGKVGHYLPAHGMELTKSTAVALQYLQGLKPHTQTTNPLDTPIPPSKAQIARYNRALGIATQPTVVLQHVKDGTIQTTDIQDLSHMYPQLYRRMVQKLSDQMLNRKADEEPIPYKTRIGISLFIGQPMDTSMQPMSILSAQPKPKPQPQAQEQGNQPKSMKSLGKSNNTYRTPSQASEQDRANRE